MGMMLKSEMSTTPIPAAPVLYRKGFSEAATSTDSLSYAYLEACVAYFAADEQHSGIFVGAMKTFRKNSDKFNEAVGGATDVVSGGTTIIGIISGSASAAADMQLIAAVALSTCADPHLRGAFGSFRTLSPFALYNSYLGVMAGNALAIGAVLVLQLLVLLVLRIVKGEVIQWAKLTAMVRFPGLTLCTVAALHTGLVYSASQMVSLPDREEGDLAFGGLGVAYAVLMPLCIALFAFKFIPRAYQTYDDRTEFAASKKLPLWSLRFLAKGIITPQSTRQSFQTIIATCRHPSPIWPTYSFWGPTIIMIGGFIHPSTVSGCVALFSCMALAYFAIALMIYMVQPLRSDCYNALEAIGKILSGLILVCGAVGVATDDSVIAARASKAAIIFGIMQLVFAILRTCYSLVVRYFDRIFDKDLVRLHVVWAHTTDSNATAKRFALPDEGNDGILRQVALTRDGVDLDDIDLEGGVQYPKEIIGIDDMGSKIDVDLEEALPSKDGDYEKSDDDGIFDSDSIIRTSDGDVAVKGNAKNRAFEPEEVIIPAVIPQPKSEAPSSSSTSDSDLDIL